MKKMVLKKNLKLAENLMGVGELICYSFEIQNKNKYKLSSSLMINKNKN